MSSQRSELKWPVGPGGREITQIQPAIPLQLHPLPAKTQASHTDKSVAIASFLSAQPPTIHEVKALRQPGWRLVGLSIAGPAVVVALLGAARLVGSATEEPGRGYSEEEWMKYVESWKRFVEAKEKGVITEDEGEWKNICYGDGSAVYIHDNVTLAGISEEKKRWFAFEGSMPDDERQLFLTRYYLFMTDGERNAIRSTIYSPDFLRYFDMSDEERKAVWNNTIWNRTIPDLSTEESELTPVRMRIAEH